MVASPSKPRPDQARKQQDFGYPFGVAHRLSSETDTSSFTTAFERVPPSSRFLKALSEEARAGKTRARLSSARGRLSLLLSGKRLSLDSPRQHFSENSPEWRPECREGPSHPCQYRQSSSIDTSRRIARRKAITSDPGLRASDIAFVDGKGTRPSTSSTYPIFLSDLVNPLQKGALAKPSAQDAHAEANDLDAQTTQLRSRPLAAPPGIFSLLPAMSQQSDRGQPSRIPSSISAPSRQRANLDDLSVVAEESAKRRTVRRDEGKRAESEATASMRAKHARSLDQGDGSSSAWSAGGSSVRTRTDSLPASRLPFASVRRMFRPRTKSSAIPKSASASMAPDGIAESEIDGGAGRAMPHATQPTTTPHAVTSTDYAGDAGGDSSKPASSFLGFARARKLSIAKEDQSRSLDHKDQPQTLLQRVRSQSKARKAAAEKALREVESPEGAASPSSLEKRKAKAVSQPPVPSTVAGAKTGHHRSNTLQTMPDAQSISSSTPVPAADEPATKFASRMSTVSGAPLKASVPRIWMTSRNSQTSFNDNASNLQLSGTERGSEISRYRRGWQGSATSESGASFRTAQSFSAHAGAPPLSLDVPITSEEMAGRDGHDCDARHLGSPYEMSSPLADLIENLAKTPSLSSRDAPISRTASLTVRSRGSMRAVAAGLTPTSVRFPSVDSEYGEDQGGDSDSVSESSSSYDTRRVQPKGSTTRSFKAYDQSTDPQSLTMGGPNHDSTSMATLGEVSRHDVSVSEIEISLAAVEAALKNHRIQGSLDPNPLRPYFFLPRQHADASFTSLQAHNGSFAALEEAGLQGVAAAATSSNSLSDASQQQLARVRIEPEQERAITDAIRQVRRAISSSNLPQIPNEEGSTLSGSPRFATTDDTDFEPMEVIANETQRTEQSGNGETPQPTLRTTSLSRESTPMRAARNREESMQDVEQAYQRMLDLVSSAAGIEIGTPSPMPAAKTWCRRTTQSQPTPASARTSKTAALASDGSPQSRAFTRDRTKSAAPTPFSQERASTQARQPPLPSSLSRAARQQLLRESDSLSRVVGALPGLSEENIEAERGLRGRSSNLSQGSRRAMSASPPRSRFSSAVDVMTDDVAASRVATAKEAGVPARAATVSSRNGSGGSAQGGNLPSTSPSATGKTQGTPRLSEVDHHSELPELSTAAQGYPHFRSQSQQVADWRRTRLSSASPISVRHGAPVSNRMSGASFDSSSVARPGPIAGSADSQRRLLEDQSAFRASAGRGPHAKQFSAATSTADQHSPIASASAHTAPFRESSAMSFAQPSPIHNWRSGGTGSAFSHTADVPFYAQEARGGTQAYDSSGMAPTNRSIFAAGGRLSDVVSPAQSLLAAQRRHTLERNSLLDMLERSRAENAELRASKGQLQADLHQEVTRVLELDRELSRQREQEMILASRIESLEEELKEEHADRVRIGELLEKVQRAVDEAAHSRGISQDADMEDNEDDEEDDNNDGASHAEGAHLMHQISYSGSSDTSIRQEDLHPASQRILDMTRAVDADEPRESTFPHLASALEARSPSSPLLKQDNEWAEAMDQHRRHPTATASSSRRSSAIRKDQEAYSYRSPSLYSHTSVLGLSMNDNEMEWTLDEERPPEGDIDEERESPDVVAGPKLAKAFHAAESSRLSPSPTLQKGLHISPRPPSSAMSRIPRPSSVVGQSSVKLTKSDSTTSSTQAPIGANILPAIDSGRRVPSSPPAHARSGRNENVSGDLTKGTSKNEGNPSLKSSGSISFSSPRDSRMFSTSSSMISAGPLPSYQRGTTPSRIPSLIASRIPSTGLADRNASSGSGGTATTGADTSYTAQTVSPFGEFVPTFTSRFVSGGRRNALTGARESVEISKESAPKNTAEAGGMRGVGGYYDPHRPAGYDPVDASVLDVLEVDDSYEKE